MNTLSIKKAIIGLVVIAIIVTLILVFAGPFENMPLRKQACDYPTDTDRITTFVSDFVATEVAGEDTSAFFADAYYTSENPYMDDYRRSFVSFANEEVGIKNMTIDTVEQLCGTQVTFRLEEFLPEASTTYEGQAAAVLVTIDGEYKIIGFSFAG